MIEKESLQDVVATVFGTPVEKGEDFPTENTLCAVKIKGHRLVLSFSQELTEDRSEEELLSALKSVRQELLERLPHEVQFLSGGKGIEFRIRQE